MRPPWDARVTESDVKTENADRHDCADASATSTRQSCPFDACVYVCLRRMADAYDVVHYLSVPDDVLLILPGIRVVRARHLQIFCGDFVSSTCVCCAANFEKMQTGQRCAVQTEMRKRIAVAEMCHRQFFFCIRVLFKIYIFRWRPELITHLAIV